MQTLSSQSDKANPNSNLIAMASNLIAYCLQPKSDGLQPNSDGLQPRSNGLQPNSDGLQPNSDGLQPTCDGLQPNREPNRELVPNTVTKSLIESFLLDKNQRITSSLPLPLCLCLQTGPFLVLSFLRSSSSSSVIGPFLCQECLDGHKGLVQPTSTRNSFLRLFLVRPFLRLAFLKSSKPKSAKSGCQPL